MFFMNKIMIKLWTQTFHSYEGKSSKKFLKIEWTWFHPLLWIALTFCSAAVGVAVRYIVGAQTLGFFVDIDKVSPS